MNALIPVEPITPRNLRVVACPHPFSNAVVDTEMAAGFTILDLIYASGSELALLGNAHVWISDMEKGTAIDVPRENWHRVRPKPGMLVTIRVIPGRGGGGGGGKNPLRTILTIAVIASSFVVPYLALEGYLGVGLQAFAEAGHIGGSFYVGAGALGIATPIVGPVLVNSVVPPQP